MSNQTTLAINPNWQPPTTGKVVIYVQAWTTSSYQQKVTITGKGITTSLVGTSKAGAAYGSQYLNQKIVIDDPTLPYPNWQYTVSIQYSTDNGNTWIGSNVVGSDDTSIINGLMYVSFALSNDGGTDKDFNDTVVQITAFNNSTD